MFETIYFEMKMTYSGMLHRLRYYYVFFLRAIVVSGFRSLEIFKNLWPFLVYYHFYGQSHADNHFYRYIYNYYYYTYYYYYLYKYYTIWNRFLIRIRVNVFYIQIRSTCKTSLLLFLIKTWFTEKNLYRKN